MNIETRVFFFFFGIFPYAKLPFYPSAKKVKKKKKKKEKKKKKKENGGLLNELSTFGRR